MILLGIISGVLIALLVYFSIVFFANAITALIVDVPKHPDVYYKTWMIQLGGICYFLTVFFFIAVCVAVVDLKRDNKRLMKELKKECKTYEQIEEPIYRLKTAE